MDIDIKMLATAQCFRDFGVIEMEQILGISHKVPWKAGETIFKEGDPGRDMFVICSGTVTIQRKTAKGPMALASLSAGRSFGEMALVHSGRRSATAKAEEDTVTLRISYDRLSAAPDAAPILYANIARELAKRLNMANNMIVFQAQTQGKAPPIISLGGDEQCCLIPEE